MLHRQSKVAIVLHHSTMTDRAWRTLPILTNEPALLAPYSHLGTDLGAKRHQSPPLTSGDWLRCRRCPPAGRYRFLAFRPKERLGVFAASHTRATSRGCSRARPSQARAPDCVKRARHRIPPRSLTAHSRQAVAAGPRPRPGLVSRIATPTGIASEPPPPVIPSPSLDPPPNEPV